MTQRSGYSILFDKIRKNIHFVLVEPEVPGNVGSVARALKTCGFENLILVNPCDITHTEAAMMAHRSTDILNKAVIFQKFNDAVSNMRLTVGTTMRKRHFRFPFYSPDEIAEKFLQTAPEHPVAIVFGRERTGLTNEELVSCHLHSTITTATQNPSLNLAQAVMVYAYTFFQLQNTKSTYYKYDLATQYELEKFYEHLGSAMHMVNFVPRDGIDNFVIRFRRLLGRALAEKRDIRLLHKLLQIFETRIQDLESGSEENQRNIY
jgi:TrmH family RNA methyltransferase